MLFYLLLAPLVVAVIRYFILRSLAKSRKEKAAELKIEYDIVRGGTNKELARVIGEEYYSALRGGPITAEDDTAIRRDLDSSSLGS